MEKNKMVVTGRSSTQKIKTGKCCGKGVGSNSILCTKCKNWCHKRCSGLKRVVGVPNFQCSECKKDKVKEEKRVGTLLGVQIEEVPEFCWIVRLEWREQ